MLFFSLISPYEYWDSTKTYINDDVMLVLRIYWLFAIILNAIFVFLNRQNKRFLFIYVTLFFLSIIRFMSLFLQKRQENSRISKETVGKIRLFLCYDGNH